MHKDLLMITGATGLLGGTYAKYFASLGLDLILTGRSNEKLELLRGEILSEHDVHIEIFAADHASSDAAINLIEDMKRKEKLPTLLINNVRDLSNLVNDHDNNGPNYKQWQGCFQLGVIFPYELVNNLREYGTLKSVVNVSSMYGVVVPNLNLYKNETDSPIHYGIVKAAQNHLTKELAVRMAKYDISVNAIAYGGVEGRASKEFKEKYRNLCPKKRMLNSDEILDTAKYLLLDANNMLTGQIISVTGGWELW